jgi:hypothetical protein
MAERALELLWTAPGGAIVVRTETLAAPVLARAVEGMEDRGWECAIGVRTTIYEVGGGGGEDDRISLPVLAAGENDCPGNRYICACHR